MFDGVCVYKCVRIRSTVYMISGAQNKGSDKLIRSKIQAGNNNRIGTQFRHPM